jgi:DNA-binding transcriptional LysR family regulator
MEFQQLEMFVAVVEEGNISGGADRVCRTVPAVSIALRKLEAELGTALFDRSERNYQRLTTAGNLFYSHSGRILEMRSAARRSVKDLILGRHRPLRLGAHESVSLYVLPQLLHRFHEARGTVNTEIVCGSSERLLSALRTGAIELAVIAEAPTDPDLKRDLLLRDELVLITGPQHRLSAAQSTSIRDLADEFLLVQGSKSLLRERIVRALNQSGIPFSLGAENIAIEAIKRMVADGLGIGFVPLMCVGREALAGELSTIRVRDIPSEWRLWLVRRKNQPLTHSARSFVEFSLANLRNERPERLSSEHQNESVLHRKNAQGISDKAPKTIHC